MGEVTIPGQATVDRRARYYLPATRVVWCKGVAKAAATRLLEGAAGVATVFGRKGLVLQAGASVLLDFGHELHGGVQVFSGDTPGKRPARVRVRFGESVSEAMGRPNNDHAIHDGTVDLPWYGMAEAGSTGFRFVRIDVPPKTASIELQGIRGVLVCRDLKWKGAFECNDDRLNRIWTTGAWTVFLNMQEHLWDGVKRDRLVWLGDLHVESRVITAVFGACDVVPRSLDFGRDEKPLPAWINTISTYSLWWILAHRDWYLAHGDRATLRAQGDYLRRLVKQVASFIGRDGVVAMPAAMLDHPTSQDPAAVQAGQQAMVAWALDGAAWIARQLGDRRAAATYAGLHDRVMRHAPDPGSSKPAAAVQILSGMADAADLNRRVLAEKPLQGLSPFFGYYILEARAKAGDIGGCLDLIRRYWGGMLDLGATSFWEHFDLAWMEKAGRIDEPVSAGRRDVHRDCGQFCYTGWRHSLCHGWSAGPTAWLSDRVLGVQPAAPGFRQVRIHPALGDLEWAEGSYPTPHGEIRVRHRRRRDGTVKSEVRVPRGVTVVT